VNTVTEKEKIRLFVALDLPLVNDQNGPIQFTNSQLLIGQAIADFRPVKSYHVTLVFIGLVNQSLIAQIKIALERAIAQFVNEQKQGLTNGIGQLMIKPGASIMGKNAVALSLVDNYLIEALIDTILRTFQQYQIPHAARHEALSLHVTIGRVPIDAKKQVDTKRFLDLLPAPVGGRAQLNETFTATTISLYESHPNSEYVPLAVFKI
jgi:2'-5' RNA ligase